MTFLTSCARGDLLAARQAWAAREYPLTPLKSLQLARLGRELGGPHPPYWIGVWAVGITRRGRQSIEGAAWMMGWRVASVAGHLPILQWLWTLDSATPEDLPLAWTVACERRHLSIIWWTVAEGGLDPQTRAADWVTACEQGRQEVASLIYSLGRVEGDSVRRALGNDQGRAAALQCLLQYGGHEDLLAEIQRLRPSTRAVVQAWMDRPRLH